MEIIPMSYMTFNSWSKTRVLKLFARPSETPFLREAGVDAAAFIVEPTTHQLGFGLSA